MPLPRIFIDGHVGTTGLRIRELLADRADLSVASLAEEERKSPEARRRELEAADLVVLCLPDQAAHQAASWLEGSDVKIIDASTAHRVADGWTYGLPELVPAQRDAIRNARCVSNPGCYPTALLLALRPLIDARWLAPGAPITMHALSGYSGGGRVLIERWEDADHGLLHLPYEAPYALDRIHKHIPEMQAFAGLIQPPVFVPAVGPFHSGMRAEIPLHASMLESGATAKTLWEALDGRYRDEPFVKVQPLREPLDSDESSFDPRALNGTNRLEITVSPNPSGHVLLIVLLDNLGKGAAGVAVQNLNLMLGLPESTGLA